MTKVCEAGQSDTGSPACFTELARKRQSWVPVRSLLKLLALRHMPPYYPPAKTTSSLSRADQAGHAEPRTFECARRTLRHEAACRPSVPFACAVRSRSSSCRKDSSKSSALCLVEVPAIECGERAKTNCSKEPLLGSS